MSSRALDLYRRERQVPPACSLGILIIFVTLVTVLSFWIFWQSETRSFVNSIQATSHGQQQSTQTPADGVNTDGKLSVPEFLYIVENVQAERDKLHPEVDFGGGNLEQTNLGF